ncbi:hypothetical protein PTKIN_Ptkin14bG0086900 [Pterospermum kingtungense]
MSQIGKLKLRATVFERMPNLKFIKFYYTPNTVKKGKLLLADQDLQSLPNQLRYLYWEDCPLKALPSNFNPENLVELILYNGNVEQLWSGDKNLPNLRVIHLAMCKNLIRMPNLSQAKKLQELYIWGCKSLVEFPSMSHLISFEKENGLSFPKPKKFPGVVPHSMKNLRQLTLLNLSHTRVRELSSNICKLESLRYLELISCPITEFPKLPRNLTLLDLSMTRIQELPYLTGCLKLTTLYLDGTQIEEVPSSVECLGKLATLSLSGTRIRNLLSKNVSLADQYQCTFGDGRFGYFIQFDNCINLSQEARNNIVANALLRCQSMVRELVKKFVGANGFQEQMGCCLPGCEISKRFEHQSASSSIIVKLGRDSCSSRFLGFALCIVVDIKPHGEDSPILHEWLEIICKYHLKTKSGNYHPFQSRWICPLYDTESIHLEYSNDHVFILFDGQLHEVMGHDYEEAFDGQLHEVMRHDYEEALFEFHVIASSWNGAKENIKVAKCGVHVFYKGTASSDDCKAECGENSNSTGEGEQVVGITDGCNSSLIQYPTDLKWLPSKL